MLIVPFHRRWSARHFPIVTLAIALVNVFVFFALQLGDSDSSWNRAVEYYGRSGLAELERPRFVSHLESTGQNELLLWLQQQGNDPASLLTAVESDLDFQQNMNNGLVFPMGDPLSDRWKPLREELNRLFASGFSERFMLSYDQPRAAQWLTHMFLHGGFGHLLGNMIFLVLLGMLVEPAMRAGVFTAAYLTCGVIAGSASFALHQGEPSGMLGASGAIAGLMGMFTTLFGMRKVRFLYWAFVYFDYVRAPAIILLPFWLGWELVQLIFVDANVAFEAHAAGIAAGAVIGWLLHQVGLTDLAFLEERSSDHETATRAPNYNEVRAALRSVELDRAQRLLQQIMRDHPDDPVAWELQYRVARFEPGGERFHRAARWLLLTANPAPPQSIKTTWDDYRQITQGKVRLQPHDLVQLGIRLVAADDRQAVSIFQLVRKKSPETRGLPDLARAIKMVRSGRQQPM